MAVKTVLVALMCAASLLAQGPPPEKYHSVKVTKIVSYPTVPVYAYTLSSNYVVSSPTPIDVKEGSEVKSAMEGKFMYIIDDAGKTQEYQWFEFNPPPPFLPSTKQ